MPEITVFLDPEKLPHRAQPKPVFDKNMGNYYGVLPTFNAQLNVFGAQVTAIASDVTAKASAASASAQLAAASAIDAASIAGADAWVSGRTYAKNASAISQMNFQTYRRRVAGSGTIDPLNDSTNWAILNGDGAFIPQAIPAGSINLAIGNYHTKTIASNQAFTLDNCPSDGFSVIIRLTVTSGIVSLPTSVVTPDSVPYTLTAGRKHLLMLVTENRGVNWLMAAATNYPV